MDYYTERIQSKISKGKSTGWVLEEARCELPRGLFQWGRTGCMWFFQQQVVTTCLPGKVIRDSVPRVFIGDWSHRHLVPDMDKNSRRLGGKVQRKPHCLYKQFRYSEPLLVGKDGNTPKIQVLRCQPGAKLTSRCFWGEQSQACSVNSLLPVTMLTLLALVGLVLTFLLRCLFIYLLQLLLK